MESIYGIYGVKAGYVTPPCKEHIVKAADYLINKDAKVVILGCTELPLFFPGETQIRQADKQAYLVDPALVLAQKIVTLAKGRTIKNQPN